MRFNIISNNYEESVKVVDELQKIAAQVDGWTIDEQNPEVVFIIGGDGTFLKAVNQYNAILQQVQFLPINFGGVGFYTNLNRHYEIADLNHLFDKKNYQLVELPLLEVQASNKTFYAINELKVVNNLVPATLEVLINQVLLEKFRGSGLVFSTVSGSTGFTRSVGGAIVYPNLDLFQMVELAPISNAVFRTINSPIIFAKEQELILKNLEPKIKPTAVIVDTVQQLSEVEELTIKLADFKLQLISLEESSVLNKTKFLNEIFVSK